MPPSLTRDEVAHIAKLARLRLDDAALDRMSGELAAVLGHLATLRELDVEGVEPLAHPLELTNRLDDDQVGPSMPVEALLAMAPQTKNRFLAVPKVL